MNRMLTALIALLIVILGILMIRSSLNKSDFNPVSTEKHTAAALPESHTENWKEFSWKEGHFKIMLPALPKHVRDKTKDARTKDILFYDTFVAADEEGQGYMINTITYPRNIDNEDVATILKNFVSDIIARNPENKLNEMKEGKFKAYKAYDFSYTNGNRIIHGKIFAVIDTVYMLGVIDTNASTENDKKEMEFFMNSFDITSDPTKK